MNCLIASVVYINLLPFAFVCRMAASYRMFKSNCARCFVRHAHDKEISLARNVCEGNTHCIAAVRRRTNFVYFLFCFRCSERHVFRVKYRNCNLRPQCCSSRFQWIRPFRCVSTESDSVCAMKSIGWSSLQRSRFFVIHLPNWEIHGVATTAVDNIASVLSNGRDGQKRTRALVRYNSPTSL